MVFDNSALEYSPLLGAKGLVRDDSVTDRMWGAIDPDADRLP
ncbi:hypothetical protein ACQPZP_33735 [Spirillospora sp. CA-142024]